MLRWNPGFGERIEIERAGVGGAAIGEFAGADFMGAGDLRGADEVFEAELRFVCRGVWDRDFRKTERLAP